MGGCRAPAGTIRRYPHPSPTSTHVGPSDSSRGVIVSAEPARFLLELAGHGTTADGRPSYLTMCDDPGGPKYRTVHRHLELHDCQAHMRGTVTLGAHLKWNETCPALCYDTDDPGGYALVARAAARLRASGAWPILEQAPLPGDRKHAGGGKLWIAFDDRVRQTWAFSTAERHAPELRQIRERFPGATQVRLPGGLYRHGVNVWSEVQTYGTDDEVRYTGMSAVQTIADHLTPAGWVETIRVHSVEIGRGHRGLPATIHEGEGRNQWLARIAGSDRRWGMSGSLILARLRHVNELHCNPPLDDAELERIANGMQRYAPAGWDQYRPRWSWTHGQRRA